MIVIISLIAIDLNMFNHDNNHVDYEKLHTNNDNNDNNKDTKNKIT